VGARFPAPVQTGPGSHPTSYTMGTGSFPGVKRPGRGVDHPPPSIAEVKERVELCLYSPSGPSRLVLGWTLPLPVHKNEYHERQRSYCACFLILVNWRGTVQCIAFPYLYILRRRVEVSIPDGVIEFFHRLHSGRTMALGSTQPLTEMSTRGISWGKGGWCVGLTTLTLSHADYLWSLGASVTITDGYSLFVLHVARNKIDKNKCYVTVCSSFLLFIRLHVYHNKMSPIKTVH
jgi:hypothetical protein